MTHASLARSLALQLLAFAWAASPALTQEVCPRLSGADAEAGWTAYRSNDIAAARARFEAALTRCPDDQYARTGLGYVLLREASVDEAVRQWSVVVAAEPDNVDALTGLGLAAWRTGDVDAVRARFSRVVELVPDDPTALQYLALAWESDDEEAPVSYGGGIMEVLGSSAGPERQPRALGVPESRAAYDALLARDPQDVDARLGLAQALAFAREYPAAIAEYDRVLETAPGEVRALVGKSRVLGWSGRLMDGERVALEAVALDRSSSDAWAALGQLYRWQERDPDAKEALEMAAELAPTDPEIQGQLRLVDLALAPLAAPTVAYEEDSDGNRMLTTWVRSAWHPVPRLRLHAGGYYKDLKQGLFARSAQGVTVSGSYQIQPGWTLLLGVGGSRNDGTRDRSLVEYQVGARSPERHRVVAALAMTSVGLTETAFLADLGGRSTELLATARWSPALDWRVDGSVGIGEFSGTEDNARRSASLSTSVRVGRGISVGASARGFSFEKNLDDGYFDPDFYGVAELTGYWLHRPGPWTVLVEAAPGIEKVRRNGDIASSLRTTLRLGYAIGAGREVFLAGVYSSAGLASFATSASGYSYKAFSLGSSWTF
jgi:tetratricopeptide (TPR) repeat protein